MLLHTMVISMIIDLLMQQAKGEELKLSRKTSIMYCISSYLCIQEKRNK